jgi:fructose-1,6-bisphosphatase I
MGLGSKVSDCHRTLIQGGIFMYPGMEKKPEGKLRLAYESMPMALIFETCGGKSWDEKGSILNNTIDLKNIHQKIPTYLGNTSEIEKFI